jgi:hypothetical protein
LKAIARRLARLEDRFVPRETEESRHIRELLRQARERAAKDTGHSHQEPPPLPPTNNGHPWTIGDILVARRDQIRRLEAAQQQ